MDFIQYLAERELIRQRKLRGEFPLTCDPILREWKFTNVKRLHDRTTQDFLRIYEDHLDAEPHIVLLNCAIARYFGTKEFYYAVGWQSRFQPTKLKRVAKRMMDNKQKVFTGAYIITNQGIKAPKYEVVVDIFITEMYKEAKRLAITMRHQSFEKLMGDLQKVQGFGGSGFMAKEVLLDTIFFDCFSPTDMKVWTPLGPGARRGINRYMERDKDTKVKFDEVMPVINKLMKEARRVKILKALDINMHDIQFALCEWDKYQRVLKGEGKPRSRYGNRNSDIETSA